MSDSDAPTNVSVRDLDYSGLRKAIDTRLNKYFERLDAPESHERPKDIHCNDFYKFTIRAEEPNVEFIKFVPKIMWCSKPGVYKHVSREWAYELRIVLDEFCEEWCSQWLTGDAGIFFVQIRTNLRRGRNLLGEDMERKKYPRFFTEADLGAHLTDFLLKLDEDFLRTIMAQIVMDEGYGCPIYNEKNEPIFVINIDPSKLSHNNPRKMVTAYTAMDVEEIRKFVRDLYYKSCIDQGTRGAKIRCDLRLEGQRVISQVKLWEEGDSDYNEVGDEDEDESLFEEVLGSRKKDEDAVWRRRIWFAFEKMRAPQLRRAIHMTCGGVYKMDVPADEEYINEKDDLTLQRIIAVILIVGTRVVLTHEAATCDLLEKMTPDELRKTLIVLCNAQPVYFSFIEGEQLMIDGRTITLDILDRVKPQDESSSESSSESGEQDPSDEYPEEEEAIDHGEVEVETPDEEPDEEPYEPESPIHRKRPRLWV
ncbi:uncharacterized protein EAF02_005766 [Botrytis sinoallii]|uniref:uncharacterized protein n=1 Tax=Botrytis sinoallii TaxID=1463999 RepID=UPI0018FF3B33|nr:uncharacterized protein EAF02_005766 [Botrytis sinoallii]KAF7882403.1 hypothetical protein EAF02_005766 [Botrytis sinoallii]